MVILFYPVEKSTFKICVAMEKTFTNNQLNLVAILAVVSVFLLSTMSNLLLAQCSVIGTGNINGNVNFGAPINWANPNRVTTSDDLYARARLDAGDTTKYLMVADFGFALAPGAVILGIDVQVEIKHELLADGADASIVLMKGGTAVGADRVGTGIYEDKDRINTYGSSTDMWGTTWTAADINDAGFGVLFSATRNSGPNDLYIYIDQILVTVYFTGGSCILPISLADFEAHRADDNSVAVNWVTTSETNNDYFSIERSSDGVNFSGISTISGNGSSSNFNSYNYNDDQPLASVSYYRLMQVDQDGQFSYSETVAVDGIEDSFGFDLWPNPASSQVTLAAKTEDATVQIMDLTGKVVLEKHLGKLSDSNNTIDVTGFGRGMYILAIRDGISKKSRKLILK